LSVPLRIFSAYKCGTLNLHLKVGLVLNINFAYPKKQRAYLLEIFLSMIKRLRML
jgi:hypothetical protein